MLPFEITDVPDQGNFKDTLSLAMGIAGEIFLSLNSKSVKKPSLFDIYRIAVVQQMSPQIDIHNVVNPLGFKVKQGSTAGMTIHNLNDITFLFKLDETGDILKQAMAWWKRNWPTDPVDPCLSAAFGLLMDRENTRKQPWNIAKEDTLAKLLTAKWSIIELADDYIKESFAEVTWDPVAQMSTFTLNHNNQVMLGLAYIWNQANPKSGILIPSGVNFALAKNRVL